LPCLVVGVLMLFKNRSGFWWIVPAWLLIGIIPAATARETPHALRIAIALPTFQIIVAYGFIQFLLIFKNHKLNTKLIKTTAALLLMFLFFNFFYFYRNYLTHYPYEFSGEWQYGYKDSINYVKSLQNNYDNIYITNELGRPYIYYLFYLEVDSKTFRENSTVRRDVFGFVTVDGFGKYRFLNSAMDIEEGKKNLFINTPKNVPPGANVLKNFHLLNKNVSLVAYE